MSSIGLHTLLGLVVAAAAAVLFWLLPLEIAIAVVGGWSIFLREVTQKQSAKHENDFRKGWAFWRWQEDKIWETVLPILTLFILAFIVLTWRL